MKPELADHLDKVRATVEEVERIVDLHEYPEDPRTVPGEGTARHDRPTPSQRTLVDQKRNRHFGIRFGAGHNPKHTLRPVDQFLCNK